MWKITLLSNIVVMFFFWIAGKIAVTPAYNHFVRYPETGGELALPVITETAFAICNAAVILPVIWIAICFPAYRFMKKQPASLRNECLLAFTSITTIVGFLLLLFFGLAGILPFLRIGAAI